MVLKLRYHNSQWRANDGDDRCEITPCTHTHKHTPRESRDHFRPCSSLLASAKLRCSNEYTHSLPPIPAECPPPLMRVAVRLRCSSLHPVAAPSSTARIRPVRKRAHNICLIQFKRVLYGSREMVAGMPGTGQTLCRETTRRVRQIVLRAFPGGG